MTLILIYFFVHIYSFIQKYIKNAINTLSDFNAEPDFTKCNMFMDHFNQPIRFEVQVYS